jgi:uncharacterized protein RhaS with RHS repeats
LVTSEHNRLCSYDFNGNMVSGGGRSYTWSAHNQPISITSGGVTESYLYDADGARVKKTRGSVSTVYQAGGLVEEDLSPSSVRRSYLLNGQVVAQRTVTSTATTLVYLHGDHLGSIAAVTSGTSTALLSSQNYKPYGEVRTGSVTQTELNFTGQRKDGTGLLSSAGLHNLLRF